MKIFRWEDSKQLSKLWIFLSFALPALYATFLFRFILPKIVDSGLAPVVAWSLIACFGLATLVVIGIVLLNKEARTLDVSLWERSSFKKLTKRQWLQVSGLIILGIIASLLAKPLTLAFMDLFNLQVPTYLPFWLDPSINIATTDPGILSPTYNIVGQYWLIGLLFVTLLLNVLAEELYFRAYLLPKMVSYKTWGWIMNGLLFASYHIFQFWLFPTLAIASLAFAFIFYRYRSIYPLFLAHLAGNVIFSTIALATVIIG